VEIPADIDSISVLLGERLIAKGLLQPGLSLQQYCHGINNPDKKLIFLDKRRSRLAVMVSPPLFPNVVAEECLRAEEMRSHLGELATPIPEPLDSGRIRELSYAVLPYRAPLSRRRGLGRLDQMRVKRQLLDWLHQIAERRSAECGPSRYRDSLRALSLLVSRESATAALIRIAEEHLRSGRFAPRTAPMHGDLWRGNVLHGAASPGFTVVDWRGSLVQGFPVFDLVRIAESFDLSSSSLGRELKRHQVALTCRVEDLPLYLLGALGHYAAHLGEMPPALFRAMADECVRRLGAALGIAGPRSSHDEGLNSGRIEQHGK
jgi:hypothetical protein